MPAAPAYAGLPEPRRRARRGGPICTTISALIEVVTPILGGGSQTRTIDEIDVIRPATVRGHLRFWWRALYGHELADPGALWDHERTLWGCAAAGDRGGRSAVEIRVKVTRVGEADHRGVHPQQPGGYALWPAREERAKGVPPAPRRLAGTRFRLVLVAPEEREQEVRNAVRAWLLFGGYGSRTRRGLGSVSAVEDAAGWLPASATAGGFQALFGRSIFAPPGRAPVDTPWLAGAALHVGKVVPQAESAWTAALGWLQEFRQGHGGAEGRRAREPGAGNRPSISNWPEADKVRQLSRPRRAGRWAHPPRHNATPAWPRAGFGLPIVGRFQSQSREGCAWHELPRTHRNHGEEPGDFTLVWRPASGEPERDRLASPLIVKALPLASGGFAPCALWLCRAYPAGEVCLQGRPGSGAPFDRLVAPGDTPRFSALADPPSLRAAFLGWLRATHRTSEVAP